VDPYPPPARAIVNLEHREPGGLPDRQVGGDLMVRRPAVRERELVIDVAARQRRETAEAHLQPLVRAVRAFPGAADTDPSGDVAGEDVEGADRRDRGADAEGIGGGGEVRVAVAVRGSATECARRSQARCGGA